jgi:hypothetical protein
MRQVIAIACALLMISGGVWAQQSGAQAPSSHPSQAVKKKSTSARKKSRVLAAPAPLPAQALPPVPATLMNSAPVTPNVTMQNGLLTIDAPNSTLNDVLNGVHDATGASIEGALPSERVAVRLGPGNPGQVIAALLTGTRYDYLILGSLEKPDAVVRVLLKPSSQGASSDQAAKKTMAGGGMHRPQPIGIRQPQEDNPPDAGSDDTMAQPGTDTSADQAPQDSNQPRTRDQIFRDPQPVDPQRQR